QRVTTANLRAIEPFFAEHAERIGWIPPRGGLTAWPWLGSGGGSRPFCEEAAARGGLLAPGDCFGAPSHFRIGFGAGGDDISKAVDRLTAPLGRPLPNSPQAGAFFRLGLAVLSVGVLMVIVDPRERGLGRVPLLLGLLVSPGRLCIARSSPVAGHPQMLAARQLTTGRRSVRACASAGVRAPCSRRSSRHGAATTWTPTGRSVASS